VCCVCVVTLSAATLTGSFVFCQSCSIRAHCLSRNWRDTRTERQRLGYYWVNYL